MNLPQNSELQDLLLYLTKQERAELEAILMATPDPIQIIRQVVRPDGSIQAYLLALPAAGAYLELAPDDPLLAGRPPVTPEQNGGWRVTA